VAGAAVVALADGVLAWGASAAQGAGVSLPRMLEAGANCLPVALLFLGLGALAFALLPRAGVGVAYMLVTVAFVWQLFGSLLGAPHWLVEATPFQHIGLVPAQPLRAGAAAAMLGVGALAALAAALVFRNRDLTGS
jgi:ABC-2 type transport system permease protein